MRKYKVHYDAYIITANADSDPAEVNAELQKIGFSLGRRSVAAAHKEYATWLTNHGLDITRGDLDQQALINDNATTVRKISKLNNAGKHDSHEVDLLLAQLKEAGIYILDIKRLERCLMLTAQKSKQVDKKKTARKRRGAKHREETRAVVNSDAKAYFDKREALIQTAMGTYNYKHGEAESFVDRLIADYADPEVEYDIQALFTIEELPEFIGDAT